jgi:polysaccharide biosynthesis transport protein
MSEPILTQLWHAFLRRIWPAAIAALIVISISIVVVMSLPDVYRASTTIELHTNEGIPESIDANAESLEAHMFSLTNYVLGRESLSQIIKEFDLYPALREESSNGAVVETMRRDIGVVPQHVDGDWGRRVMVAFELSYRGYERETVERVVNRLANVFIVENNKLYDVRLTEALSSLELQVDVARERMVSIETKLQAYRQQNTGRLPEQVAVNLSTLERLNSDLRLTRENMMRLMDRRAEIHERRFDAVDVSSSDERTRLARLKNELVTLKGQVSSDHPTLRRLRAEIASIEANLGSSGAGNGIESLEETQFQRIDDRMADLVDEESRIMADIARYEARIEMLPRVEHELTGMKREYDAARGQYTSLLDRYQRSRLEEINTKTAGPQLRMMDVPLAPNTPEEPQRIRLLLMGFIVSLLFAGGVVALLEQLDTSFHTMAELQSYTNVPIAAIIPSIVIDPSVLSRLSRYLLIVMVVGATVAAIAIVASNMSGDENQVVITQDTGRG